MNSFWIVDENGTLTPLTWSELNEELRAASTAGCFSNGLPYSARTKAALDKWIKMHRALGSTRADSEFYDAVGDAMLKAYTEAAARQLDVAAAEDLADTYVFEAMDALDAESMERASPAAWRRFDRFCRRYQSKQRRCTVAHELDYANRR